MHPALLALWLAVLHLSGPVDCYPLHPDPSRRSSNKGARTNFVQLQKVKTRDMKMNLNGQVRKTVNRDSLIILPMTMETTNFVSIFDLKSKRFLCMDTEGKMFRSMMVSREECLFQGLGLESHLDILYSSMDGLSLNPKGPKNPKPSSVLLKRLILPLVHRQKRSQHVNPSDPLRSENPHPKPSKERENQEHQQQEQAGAVSKETVTSCDDPLQVLHSNGPVSPIKTAIVGTGKE